jgi:malonate transporter and related proteins
MNWQAAQPVWASLAPVFLLIGAGVLAGRMRWIRSEAVTDLSNLCFMMLIPALLFRTMSGVRVEQVDLLPIAVYFPVALSIFAIQVAWFGFAAEGIVKALGGTFANMVMIGITLVELAYGKSGLVTLLTLVSVHALILLTVATVVLELAGANGQRKEDGGAKSAQLLTAVGRALKGSLLHPIPMPIMAGLLFAQTGWTLPPQVDRPLALLGQAFGPISLVLVGVTLAGQNLRSNWKPVLAVVMFKNVLLPLAVAVVAWWVGVRGLAYTVMVVAAGLPVGANAFIFAQRYRVAQDVTTSAMGLSTVMALFSLSAIMLLLA